MISAESPKIPKSSEEKTKSEKLEKPQFLDLFVANLKEYQAWYRSQPRGREEPIDVVVDIVLGHVWQSVDNAQKGFVWDPRKASK